ncbi:flippase-like domain-containing protein [Candidatus Peregrinibacteria bacterium]|nr:flippase-like domain-containing protein [Candidatus Peregrinibacteria bacterium]
MRPPSALLTWGLKAIGVGLFLWILSRLDAAQVFSTLRSASPLYVAIAFLLFLPIYLAKAWRWHVLVRGAGIDESFRNSFALSCASMFLGVVTPGKIGEAYKIPALRARGASLKTGVELTVLDRFFDVGWIAALAIPSVGLLFGMQWAGFTLGIALVAAVAGFLHPRTRGWLLASQKMLVPALVITTITWILYFLQLFILAEGFALAIDPVTFVAIMTIVGILSILPIAPYGLGTREAALLFFLAPLGVEPSRIVAFSFSIFLLTLIASLPGGFYWLTMPHPAP